MTSTCPVRKAASCASAKATKSVICDSCRVALHVSLHVAAKPLRNIVRRTETRRGQTARQDFPLRDGFGLARWQRRETQELHEKWRLACRFPQLPPRHRMQSEVAGASSQRFGDVAKESKVGRSGKNEPSRAPLFVNAFLQCQQQFRTALHLVEDGGVCQQRFGIRPRRRQRGEIVERAVGVSLRERWLVLKQRAFAGLPQAGEHYHGQLPQRPLQARRDFAGKVVCHNATRYRGIMTSWQCLPGQVFTVG